MTQVDSSLLAPSEPAMCGSATLAMELSSTSMKVARVTVSAMIHGLTLGTKAACAYSLTVVASGIALVSVLRFANAGPSLRSG
jgi:hypothetical protein